MDVVYKHVIDDVIDLANDTAKAVKERLTDKEKAIYEYATTRQRLVHYLEQDEVREYVVDGFASVLASLAEEIANYA